jgi:MFS family permease
MARRHLEPAARRDRITLTFGNIRSRLQPGPSLQAQNIWNLNIEVAFFGFMFGVLQAFLNVYAIRLGASNTQIGLLNSAQPFIFAIGAIPAARFVERRRRHIPLIVASSMLYRFGVLALGLMPFLLSEHRAEAVVVIVLLMSIPQVISNIAFSAMFAEIVPFEMRARVVSSRNTLLGLTGTLASFLGGLYLGATLPPSLPLFEPAFTFPLNYQILLIFCFALSTIGVIYLNRVRAPDQAVAPAPAAREKRSLRRRFSDFVQPMITHREFGRYVLAIFIIHWGVYLPTGLYSIFWVRELHADDNFVGLILTVQSITTMVFFPFLPRIANQLGTRAVVAVSIIIISLYPLLTAFVTRLEPLLLISITGGIGNAMFGLGTFNLLLETTPQERRPSFIAIFNTAAFTAGTIAPFIGTALLDFMDIRADLLLSFAVRFAGFLAFMVMVGASSKARTSTV